MLQRERLRAPFKAFEERHVAREVLGVFRGEAPAAVHAGEVVHALRPEAAHALGDEAARPQHARDFLVRAFQYRASRVIDDWVERIAEAVDSGHGRLLRENVRWID